MEVQLDCKYLKDVKQAKERYLSRYCSYFHNEEAKKIFYVSGKYVASFLLNVSGVTQEEIDTMFMRL